MLAGLSAMIQDRLITTPDTLQSIGQIGHSVEGSIVVHGLGEPDNAEGSPRRVEVDGPERIAEDVTKQDDLVFYFAIVKLVGVSQIQRT